jgi:hypothetical protein
MHIIKKIFKEIKQSLVADYKIYINADDLKLFMEPLKYNNTNIDMQNFKERQEKSLEIIKKILDIHGKADILKYLAKLALIEPGIQKLQPWVRDHVVHAINTFLVGVYILENIKFSHNRTNKDLRFIWKITGPTHDLGYTLEVANNIVKNDFVGVTNGILNEIDTSSPRLSYLMPRDIENLNILCDNVNANVLIQKRLHEWKLKINVKNYYKLLKKKAKVDHGIIGSLAQLKIIDAIYNKINPDKKCVPITYNGLDFNQKNFNLDIISSASALFLHNIDFKYKISFKDSPIAFLLVLCDTFQEWDRYSENRKVYSGNDFNIFCSNNEIHLIVPDEIKTIMVKKLSKRLIGLDVLVNEKLAVRRKS